MNKIKIAIINWLFKEQAQELENLKNEFNLDIQRLETSKRFFDNSIEKQRKFGEKLVSTLDNIGVGVDVHQYSPSWAVVCVQGQKTDFIKFIHLGERDIREIGRFLNRFDRKHINVDLPMGFPKREFFQFH